MRINGRISPQFSWWRRSAGWLMSAWLLRLLVTRRKAPGLPFTGHVGRQRPTRPPAPHNPYQTAQAQNLLLTHVEQAREDERLHIARELHDGLGSALTCLKLDAYRLLKQEPLSGQTRHALVTLTEDIDLAIELLRSVAIELRPPVLEHMDLPLVLKQQFEAFLVRSGLDGEFVSTVDEVGLNGEAAMACYRIVQEALTNVARHAQASWVEVRLWAEGGRLVLIVRDNGRGLAPEVDRATDRLGLAGMRERASLLGADLELISAPGRGTTVRLAMPAASPAPAPGPNPPQAPTPRRRAVPSPELSQPFTNLH